MSERRARPSRSGTTSTRIDAAIDLMLRGLAVVVADVIAPEAGRVLEGLAAERNSTSPDGGAVGLPTGDPQPVDRLVSILQLRAWERDLTVLAVVGHRDAEAAAALRTLHPHGRPTPTVGLVAELGRRGLMAGLTTAADLRLAVADSPLLATGVVRVEGDGPWSERSVVAGPAVWEALVGLGGWPGDLSADPLPSPDWGLDEWLDLPGVLTARRAIEARRAYALGAFGDRPGAAAARLAALVRVSGNEPVILRAPQLSSRDVQLAMVIAAVRDLIPVFCETGDSSSPLELSVPYVTLPLLVARGSSALTAYPRALIPVPVAALSHHDRVAGLRSAAPDLRLEDARSSASAEPRDLALAATDLRGRLALGRDQTDVSRHRTFSDAVERHLSGTAPQGAVLVHPRATWDDLVLADDRLGLLRDAVRRVELQGALHARPDQPAPRRGERGLRMLFHGPPGTGKTLCAEVLARALGRDLLVVNLAFLVSKWIGETEKNLENVFDAAERASVLFFDEADALFGRRTEIGDARDRYANIETAYLLGRIESYDGVVVLSTNLRRNLDSAFARRLEFIVPFDLPDAAARERLWRLHAPTWARLSPDVRLEDLAALYDLTGALIRNAATAAGYLAAGDHAADEPGDPDTPRKLPTITDEHLARAIEREHDKAGMAYPGAPPLLHTVGNGHGRRLGGLAHA